MKDLISLMPEVLAALQGTGANVSLAQDLEDAIEADRQQRHLKEKAQLEQEWSILKSMQDQYEADRKRRGEPVAKVRDRGFEVVDGKHVPTVLVEFPVDDWESRDRFAAAVDTPQPAEPVKEVELRPQDLSISTYNPKPHPQWVAHNDRGIRVVHLPTGIVTESHEERSPHRNREIALDKLRQQLAAEPVKVPSDDLRTLQNLLSWAEAQICLHEETHRGGAIWEICDQCGAKWADDEGGRPAFEWPNEITDARALLARYAAQPQPSGISGELDAALKTAEAFNADIPVTEQEEEEWKLLEDRK